MLRSTKKVEWICPTCKSDDCECDDYEWYGDTVTRNMYCLTCDHEWREYFKIEYNGYTDDSGEYNADGVDVRDTIHGADSLAE